MRHSMFLYEKIRICHIELIIGIKAVNLSIYKVFFSGILKMVTLRPETLVFIPRFFLEIFGVIRNIQTGPPEEVIKGNIISDIRDELVYWFMRRNRDGTGSVPTFSVNHHY